MAETRLYVPNQPFDLDRILMEARHRWLRPSEICEILRNHHNFYLKPDPPVRPRGFPELSMNPPGLWLAGPKYCETSGLSNWAEVNSLSNADGLSDQKFFIEHRSEADFITDKLTDARLDADSIVQDGVTRGDINDKGNQTYMAASLEVVQVPDKFGFNLLHSQFHSNSDPHVEVTSTVHAEEKGGDGVNNEAGELKKLDSFGRWMDKEIGRDCDNSLMASDSSNYWNTLDDENDKKEVSSLSRHMQLDTDLLALIFAKNSYLLSMSFHQIGLILRIQQSFHQMIQQRLM